MSKGLIVSGGRVNHDLLLALLKKKYDMVVAVDGGMNPLWVLGYKPDVILGDFDSCDSHVLEHYRKKKVREVKFRAHKDMTDTDLAIEEMMSNGIEETVIVGGSGTRFDHTLANVMLLLKYEGRIRLTLLDANNRIKLAKEADEVWKDGYKYLSLMPISKKVQGVYLDGVAYPLSDATLYRDSSFGISNEILKERCRLQYDKGKLLIVQSLD